MVDAGYCLLIAMQSPGDLTNSGLNGLFIIRQEQDTFGASFKKNESFSGSITKRHIGIKNSSEIYTVEKECLPISSGLVFKW